MKLKHNSRVELAPSNVSAEPMINNCMIEAGSACSNGVISNVNNPMKKNKISLPV